MNGILRGKKAFNLPFSWIFAIIVGAIILFLAIFAVIKIVDTSHYVSSTKRAKQLNILLDPMETTLEVNEKTIIEFPSETRIYNKCYSREEGGGTFGEQEISTSEKSRFGEKWKKPGGATTIYNKYIFSQEVEQSKEFYVFTTQFKMPFKIANLLIVSGEKYCFVLPPDNIIEKIEDIGLDNVKIVSSEEDCYNESADTEIKTVCFLSTGCDITVYESYNYVKKDRKKLYYVDELIYGAIFSDPEIYECNVKRLISRLSELTFLYKSKSEILFKKDCITGLDSDLIELARITSNMTSSQDIFNIYNKANEMKNKNEQVSCNLF